MGPRDRRTREREQTKSRILDAAREMFVRDGLESVTMREIAKRIEYTPTAIYHHFRDKEDLFLAVFGAELARIEGAVREALSDAGTLRQRLQRVAAWFLASPDCDVGRLLAELKRHVGEERRAELHRRVRFPWEVLLPVLQASAAELRVEPELVAELFFGMLVSQARRAKLNQQPPRPDLARVIVDILLDGAGAQGTAGADAGDSRLTNAMSLALPPQ